MVQKSLKSEFTSFLVIIHTRLLCLLKLKSCSEPPRHRNVKKNHKKYEFRICCVSLVLFIPLGEMLSLILFTVNCILCLAVYFTWVSLSCKTNYERMTGQPNNKRLLNCDNRRIKTHQWHHESSKPIT